jgi:choline dehydrogenase-like flavoprotein
MLLTGPELNPAQYEHIVIGSGPGGMTLAIALANANKRVLMIESGEGTKPRSDLPQVINYGHFSNGWWGRHSIHALGGTSAVWAGWVATLMERDFTTPVNGARWPITRKDLLPFYKQAATILPFATSSGRCSRDSSTGRTRYARTVRRSSA